MAKEKVVVYGLTTEGYFIACQMAIKGADVYLVDESSPTAILLKPEVAKNCPNIDSFKEDDCPIGTTSAFNVPSACISPKPLSWSYPKTSPWTATPVWSVSQIVSASVSR